MFLYSPWTFTPFEAAEDKHLLTANSSGLSALLQGRSTDAERVHGVVFHTYLVFVLSVAQFRILRNIDTLPRIRESNLFESLETSLKKNFYYFQSVLWFALLLF